MTGAVKSYDKRKGVGAITPDRGGDDIAVYSSELERAGFSSLAFGDRLSFDVQIDRALGRSFAVNLARV
ncbi:MAG: cold-shock protein [Hyphomonadaceae bacterium]